MVSRLSRCPSREGLERKCPLVGVALAKAEESTNVLGLISRAVFGRFCWAELLGSIPVESFAHPLWVSVLLSMDGRR